MLIRKGQCNRCGECCVLRIDKETGKKIYCEHFEFRDGKGFCKIYEDRPKNCRIFPVISKGYPEGNFNTMPGRNVKNCCGYYFEEENEKN